MSKNLPPFDRFLTRVNGDDKNTREYTDSGDNNNNNTRIAATTLNAEENTSPRFSAELASASQRFHLYEYELFKRA